MAIIDDLIESWVERNSIAFSGGVTIGLVNGGVKIKGEINSTIRDVKKKKTVVTLVAPVSAEIAIGEIVLPVRIPAK